MTEGIFHTEYQTDVGPIDILIEYLDEKWVIEVKRKTITVNNCVQLNKYVDYLRSSGKKIRGYIAGPSIMDKAKVWADGANYEFIKVEFD
jgi:RecB family endonuclease NucS